MKKRSKRVVIQLPLSDEKRLEPFVENCLNEGVVLICVVGDGCAQIEDIIDELIVGDGSDDRRFITTTSHKDETLKDAISFAEAWVDDGLPEVQIVRL